MQDVTQDNQQTPNTRADRLNRQCYCVTLDRKALNESLRNQFEDAGNEASAAPELDHLFSNTPVFVPQADIETMERIVQAIESAAKQALDGFEDAVLDMFQQEWQKQRTDSMPSRLAIVDDAPETQFMFPEFQLAQQLLQARGIDTLILDPSELEYVGGALTAKGKRIDMVYNRLVDFALDAPTHEALRGAYLDGAVVVTPSPRVHALMADKRNLILLSDPQSLRDWGLSDADAGYLEQAVPRTRRVFENIIKGDYIAQNFVPAGERTMRIDGTFTTRKVDIRLYTYAGKRLLAAARVYQGQATNFRTPGGGFAPVFQV
ncbi:hypothetical protein SAMN04488490_1048 [Marinobacter sp. LV10R510-11A]|uniref:hypothetical protein n=1 Tax=Marinobacter sp. LV10R510-11A TaxID=1415568 RepID=UPI000BB8E725|nr:hypothetical protein [Marinobacter sp. LV10R510-11A]SOB75453.1 hypothetical protein SAMN04488490_1048 [Marinobacter sp. LV10R510-11A]